MPKYVETYRAAVAPWQCDHLGHMNAQYYYGAVGDAMFAIMSEIALTPQAVRDRHMSFAAVHTEGNFIRELRPGDLYSMRSTVLEIGRSSALFHHVMESQPGGGRAFDANLKAVLLNLQTRKSVEIPDDIRRAMETLAASS